MKCRARGMTLLELLVVLSLLLVLAGVLLHRLRDAQRAVERTVVVAALDTLRTGLWLEVAARAGWEGDASLARLAGENPFPRLGGALLTYGGEAPEGRIGMQEGTWYYETKSGTILYQPRFSENFFMDGVTPKGVEFKIRVIYRQDSRSSRVFEGLRVVGRCDCEWLPNYYVDSSAGR